MSIRALPCCVALGVAGFAVAGSQALAADFTTIVLSTDVSHPAGVVWKEVGDFCGVGEWLKLKCAIVSGTGGLGSVRQLVGRIDEVMVAETPHSYTITQPANKDLFHATLGVESTAPNKTKITYSIVYDQANLAPGETKEHYREQHIKMFTDALERMKQRVDGQ